MADASKLSRLGKVSTKHNKLQAVIDTDDVGVRYYFTGPSRGDDEQQAHRDLCYIRAALTGTRPTGGVTPFGLNRNPIEYLEANLLCKWAPYGGDHVPHPSN